VFLRRHVLPQHWQNDWKRACYYYLKVVSIIADILRFHRCRALLQLRGDSGKVDMNEVWRPFTFHTQGHPEGPPMTRGEKMLVSCMIFAFLCAIGIIGCFIIAMQAAIKIHISKDNPEASATFLSNINNMFEKHWGVKLSNKN